MAKTSYIIAKRRNAQKFFLGFNRGAPDFGTEPGLVRHFLNRTDAAEFRARYLKKSFPLVTVFHEA